MTRILFVDDEPNVLAGLRRSLHAFRGEWEMAFAEGGERALAALDTVPVDVVVSDMRMPGMDGAALFARLRERHPAVVRVMLSGQAEPADAQRAATVAHQFVTKPCPPHALRAAVERACRLKALLDDETALRVVHERGVPPPRLYTALNALAHPAEEVAAAARIVQRDAAVSAGVLDLVNSPFFGPPRSVTEIEDAARLLGPTLFRYLVLAAEVDRGFGTTAGLPPGLVGTAREHTLLVARIAARLVPASGASGVFAAALLHDVGQLVLARAPEPLPAEARVGHAEIGACLLGLWSVPFAIVEAVGNHHVPGRGPHPAFAAVDALHVADRLACEQVPGPAGWEDEPLDPGYVADLGLGDRLVGWRVLAAAAARVGRSG